MSEKEVNKRFDHLLKQDKISVSIEGSYLYKFKFDLPEEAIANLSGKFFKDRLYQFRLKFETSSRFQAITFYYEMCSMFREKYGVPIEVPSILVEKKSDYVFIQGNRKIEIDYPAYSSFFVTYIDIPVDAEKDEFDKKQQAKSDSITKKDI